MKKRFVTILALMLVVVFVLGFAGCGKKTDGTAKDQTTTKAEKTDTSDDTTEAQQGEEAVAPSSRIGEYVHYNVNLGIGNAKSVDDDWIVFYQDEDKGITYLIAAECIAEKNCPALATAFSRAGFMQAYFPSGKQNVDYSLTFSNYDAYNEAVIDKNVASRNMHDWTLKNPGDTHKHAFLAALLDQNVWDDFIVKGADGKKLDESIMAVGGPTLNLFEKSWEESGYTPIAFEIKEEPRKDGTPSEGYYFEQSRISPKTALDLRDLENNAYDENGSDKVYLTNPADVSDDVGYWIIGPGAGTYSNLAIRLLAYGMLKADSNDNVNCSVRPVVSFNTSLIGKDSSSEIYYLGKNING